jgi:chorismate mutase
LGPLSRDRKAYLWGIENVELARRLDAWILARERDGTLAELRTEHLGPTRPAVATPLGALLAAIDERLDLMPAVASAKRREGSVVRAPEREQKVLTAAMASTSAAAAQAETAPLPELRVRALFRAQIEAAIAVQQAVLSAPADPSAPSLDLETELRPALLRIGDRIAWLLVRLPGPLDPGDVDRQTSEALDAPGLERHHEAEHDVCDAEPSGCGLLSPWACRRSPGRRPNGCCPSSQPAPIASQWTWHPTGRRTPCP